MNWLLIGILLAAIGIFAVSFLLLLCIRGAFQSFRALTSAPDEKTPSPLTGFLMTAVDALGQSVANHIKTSLMGEMSAEVRQAQAAQRDAAIGALGEANPLMATLFGGLSKRNQNKVFGNPIAQALIARALAGGLGKGPGNGKQAADQPKFNL